MNKKYANLIREVVSFILVAKNFLQIVFQLTVPNIDIAHIYIV